jgi:membrane-associated protease RseP (regulator of RpoE activity)
MPLDEPPPPENEHGEPRGSIPEAPLQWKRNLVHFLATVGSVFLAGAMYGRGGESLMAVAASAMRELHRGWPFAVPLLAILLVHEFGHYFAARAHRVEASLPYFIPLPLLSPFGTMGAVISMRGRIKSRDALLDIGASGPLAGLIVAVPVLVIGLMYSKVEPISGPGIHEGQCLLYLALKRIVLGPIPETHDVILNHTAFAGWAGLLVTSINLIPVSQLDGGHIAYALFGPRQNRFARILHVALLGMFALNLARFLPAAIRAGSGEAVAQAVSNSMFWLLWFGLLYGMMRVAGTDHPPTEPGELSPRRKVIAAISLLLFFLLLMPTPWAAY